MSQAMANPDLRRKIKVRMRPDLTIKPTRYNGQSFFVVKDPVSLRYYRFREEELFLLQQFDGHRTLDDVRHEFVEQFRPQRISVQELEKFVGQLLQAGIATVDTPQLGRRLYERHKKRQRDKIKQTAMSVLSLKIPVFDPEKLLQRLVPLFGKMFTIPFFVMALLLMASSGLLILVNWNQFVSKLPSYHEFFTWRNLLYFWVTLGIVKVLHEFGHGISCKKFGGEVHEMGFLVLVLTPCLYCNVTDAWMLPNKWHRVVIGAAGMYVELIIASIFTWVWWYSSPGLLNTLSLSIIFVCSVSTVLFNGNPLLRFDGYYILSDLIEIPNLRERSNKYLGNVASLFFFGSEVNPDPYLPKRNRWMFAVYAVAAYLYRWLIIIGILLFFYTLLKPYKLALISQLLALGVAGLMLIVPAWKTYTQLRNRWRQMKVDKGRMAWSISATVMLLLVLLFTPLPMRIDVPMMIQPKDAVTVYVSTAGILREGQLFVEDHQQVEKGTLLAQLYNPELTERRLLLESQRDQLQQAATQMRFLDRMQATEIEVQLASARAQLDSIEEETEKLQIRAPRAGTIFMPPKYRDLGRTFKPGDTFCQIGHETDLEAFLVVPDSEINLVHENQFTWIKVTGHVGSIIEGRISKIAIRELDSVPAALSNKGGGEVATTTDRERNVERPLLKSFKVQVPIDSEQGRLLAGVRGLARIDTGWRSIYWRSKRYLEQTFHFDL